MTKSNVSKNKVSVSQKRGKKHDQKKEQEKRPLIVTERLSKYMGLVPQATPESLPPLPKVYDEDPFFWGGLDGSPRDHPPL